MRMLRRSFAVLFLMFVIVSARGQNPSPVSANVGADKATVGDTVVYSVVVELQGAGQPSVAVPTISAETGLSTPQPAGTTTEHKTFIESGRRTIMQTITYRYAIQASKVGTFDIPPATVTLNGRTYQTNPVKLVVQEVPKVVDVPKELEGLVVPPRVQDNPELQRKLTGALFILPVVSNVEPFNGEQVRISYHLVADPAALKAAGVMPQMHIDGYQIPEMNQFIKEDLFGFPQDPKFRERQIGGKMYSIAPIYETAISSTKTGKLEIEPFQISMIFSLQGRSRGAFNDPIFGGDPFNGFSPLAMMGGGAARIVAQSPKLTIDVKPLPATDQPSNFTGAVGTFSAEAKVDKLSAAAFDDTVKLEVLVEGKGDAASMQPPELTGLKGFQVLGTPQTSTSGRKEGDDYISSKKFEYTLRPTVVGPQTIPAVKVSYFDPEAEGYAVAESAPIQLEISPGSKPVSQYSEAAAGAPDVESPAGDGSELRYISTEPVVAPNAPFFDRARPQRFLLFLIPLIILATGFVVGRLRGADALEATDGQRKRRMAKVAAPSHLREAQQALVRGDYVAVCTQTAHALRTYLASKFQMPIADATIENLEEKMAGANMPQASIAAVRELLERCDAAYYADSTPASTEAKQLLDAAADLIQQSERIAA